MGRNFIDFATGLRVAIPLKLPQKIVTIVGHESENESVSFDFEICTSGRTAVPGASGRTAVPGASGRTAVPAIDALIFIFYNCIDPPALKSI